MPHSREHTLPWLVAAGIVAALNLATMALGQSPTSPEGAIMLLGLGATLAGAGLVAARSSREVDERVREERARPAREQLTGLRAAAVAERTAGPGYVTGMEAWSSSLLELLTHASAEAADPDLRDELARAAEDTRALSDLLRASEGRAVNLNELATMHSVCSLWETDQERIELLAADVDPAWHRRWRARSVCERRLRHGLAGSGELVLPYRS